MNVWNDLLELAAELSDLSGIAELMDWDQQVVMPRGGAAARAAQAATLARIRHDKLTSKRLGVRLAAAERIRKPAGRLNAALLRHLRREYDRAVRMPAALSAELASAAALTQSAWETARSRNDFSAVAPGLSRLVELSRTAAACQSPAAPYDALLDQYEEGATAADLDRMFAPLRAGGSALIAEIMAGQGEAPSYLDWSYAPELQWRFCREVVSVMGYDWRHGRLDAAEHPFTTGMGGGDVRITTHIYRNRVLSGVFSCIHECGHALYDQGIPPRFRRTPVGDGASLGFHESQSRLWENQVGRSPEFWQYFFPRLRRVFPGRLDRVRLEEFMAGVNRVESSLIRTEADEVSYNQHILLRFDLERELIAGRLQVSDLPGAWRAKSLEYLGTAPENDRDGVLQDVHWYCGLFGYFPTYTIGNMIAAGLWRTLEKDVPDLKNAIAAGDFRPLRTELRRRIHRFGALYTPAELRTRLFGTPELDGRLLLDYLRCKYSAAR